MTWSLPVRGFVDLGAEPPAIEGRRLNEGVVDEALVRRVRDVGLDRYHRRRVGWAAHEGGVWVAQAHQVLRPDASGRMRPVGRYEVVSAVSPRLADVPRRRVGDVAVERHEGAPPSPDQRAGKPTGQLWTDAQFAPSSVRRGLLATVPDPVLEVASAISWDEGRRHSVSLLVVGSSRVAVAECSLLRGAAAWQVEQLVYDLAVRADVGLVLGEERTSDG